MMADDTKSEEPPEEVETTKAAPTKAEEKPADEPAELHPAPDPETCKGIAIGLDAFWEGVHAGEWDETDLVYYLEPAGILSGPLRCARCPEDDPQPAGLLMTRAAWRAHTVFLDDGINPDTYELSFPKEFGYVKPLAHYKPETRKSEKYPWSKKY